MAIGFYTLLIHYNKNILSIYKNKPFENLFADIASFISKYTPPIYSRYNNSSFAFSQRQSHHTRLLLLQLHLFKPCISRVASNIAIPTHPRAPLYALYKQQ